MTGQLAMMGTSLVLMLALTTVVCGQSMPAEIPDNWPDSQRQPLVDRRKEILEELSSLKARVEDHNRRCSSVKKGTALAAQCQAEQIELQKQISAYTQRVHEFNKDVAAVAAATPPQNPNDAAARILTGIRKIKVPPPIPPRDAALAFGQLARGDEHSKNVILGTEWGVAIFKVYGFVGEHDLATKAIFVAGKSFIEAEDAADLYLVRQNDTYEKALTYLKNESTRPKFTAIVRALRENRPLPEDASIDMARAAQAILDPKLGNSGTRIALNSLMSPEARRAALTRACLEMGGIIAGHAAGEMAKRIVAADDPAFQEASDFLEKASVALRRTKSPEAIESLNIAVKQANEMIAEAYHAATPASASLEATGELMFTQVGEKRMEIKRSGEK